MSVLSRIIMGGTAGFCFGCCLFCMPFLLITGGHASLEWHGVVDYAVSLSLAGGFVLGALIGLLWRRPVAFRMPLVELSICCLMIALLSVLLLPARATATNWRPWTDYLLQAMGVVFASLGLSGMAFVLLSLIFRQLRAWAR